MTEEHNASSWFQDNLRIIISVGIVILLVFAIYSYSQRNSRTKIVVDDSQTEEMAMTTGENSDEINEIIDEIKDDQETSIETGERVAPEQKTEETGLTQEQTEDAMAEKEDANQSQMMQKKEMDEKQLATEQAEDAMAEKEKQKAGDVVREVIESRSTQQVQQRDGVTAVVAVHGDSMTTLARKATSDYINRNDTRDITASHKIYIEDYLRKHQSTRSIHPGTEMSYSNAAIAEAIEQSRKLTDAQLNNLTKYAQKVPGL